MTVKIFKMQSGYDFTKCVQIEIQTNQNDFI